MSGKERERERKNERKHGRKKFNSPVKIFPSEQPSRAFLSKRLRHDGVPPPLATGARFMKHF